MNEVASRVLHIWFKPMAAKGIPIERLLEGTSVDLRRLRSKSGRIDWQDFCRMHTNLRSEFSDEELVEVGRSYFRSPALRFVFVIARLRFTPMGFFRFLNTPGKGAGNQMFTCLVPHHQEFSEQECILELTLPEEFEVCWEFFLVSKGNMEEMPKLLGYPPASITLERIPRGARYHIKIPSRTPFLTRMRRFLTWPFTVRAAARELQEAHETLRDRYAEIDQANTALDQQRALLDTAYRFGQRIYGERDASLTAQAIAEALVEIAGFSGASVDVAPAAAPGQRVRATAGVTLASGDGREIDLSTRAHLTGNIRVGTLPEGDRDAARVLCELLAPTIGLALDNAFAYGALSDYQRNLEKIVEERTTELRATSAKLACTVAELTEAQSGRERFFGHISHEIRTPLSLIMLAVSDIERRAGASLDARGREGLGAVNEAARKLVRLVDELLLLAAGQEGKLRIYREPTDLSRLLASLEAAWRPAAEAAGLTLVVHTPASMVANVDTVAVERIATNLVSNAVKYTPRGGTVELAVSVEGTADVVLWVTDTGPGIPRELLARLYGRFERAAGEDRRKVGHGLGLSLVKQLAEGHGGEVIAEVRDPGPGTRMRVTFPGALAAREVSGVAPTVDPAPVAPIPRAGMVFAPEGISSGSILLAEDDVRLAEMLARELSDEYTVIVAHDGVTALSLVETHQPQMLITDVQMPGMTGIELAERFRTASNDRLAPIIILSAVIDGGSRIAGLEAGAVDYVTKPFDPRELRARVAAQFRMRTLALRMHRAEQLSALGILTAGLAHELRNPANGIVNAIAPLVEMLPKEVTAPDTGTGQLLEVMGECAQQIGFLSRQLLSFRSGNHIELRTAPVEDLVTRAVHLAQRSLNGVEVRSQLALERDVVCAPPLMIQVLTNLLENAGYAAGAGGWVEIGARVHQSRVVLEVADSGPGVPLKLRDRIFEPFFTTKPPGAGTGLGLPLARAIVHQHGGVLEIRDRGYDNGAGQQVFVIELPATGERDRTVGQI